MCVSALFQPYDSLPTSQTCFFQLRLPPYSSQPVMAERLRYAINNCRSIDMDNYMLSRNVDNAEGSDTDYWSYVDTWTQCTLIHFSIQCRLLWFLWLHIHLKHIIKCFYFTFHFLEIKQSLGGPHNLFTHVHTHTHVCWLYIPSLNFNAQSFSAINFLALPFFQDILHESVLFKKKKKCIKWQKRNIVHCV